MLEAVLAAMAGLLIGSFLNVCVYRMPRDLSVVRPRSFCPECGRTVAWYDNVPVVSYVLLKGRCRHCGKRISPRYPAVELATAALFFFVVVAFGPALEALKYCVFSALLIGLVFSDLEERILPDEFTLGGAAAGVVLAALVPLRDGIAPLFLPWEWGRTWLSVADALAGALLGSGLLWLVGVLYQKVRHREGLGLGDVKMVAMVGAFLGLYGALLTVVLGSLLGSVLGSLYILLARKKITYELPFGTFLGIAALAVAFAGEPAASFIARLSQ